MGPQLACVTEFLGLENSLTQTNCGLNEEPLELIFGMPWSSLLGPQLASVTEFLGLENSVTQPKCGLNEEPLELTCLLYTSDAADE